MFTRYSPIGRGILTGQIKSPSDIPEDDFRRHCPRFQEDAFQVNIKLVHELEKIAKQRGCTPAQLAISWVKAQSRRNGNPEIIPIPGASSEERVLENAKEVSLSGDELTEIDSILKQFEIVGKRYPPAVDVFSEG
jgi:pyridoxine 4-dehydrogenase